MGLVKTDWMDAQARGWSAPDKFVCAECVEDAYLKETIENSLGADACDYCGRSGILDIAAPAEVVIEAIYNAIHAYYCEPSTGGVPYDHGFVIEPIDIQEVLDNLGLDGHPDFVHDVINSEVNGDYFVPAADGYWAGSHSHEVLSYAWEGFCHTVMHETRFHFAELPQQSGMSPYEIDVADVLPTIAKTLRQQIRTLPAGTTVYRARKRQRGQTWLPNEKEMGPPPKEITTAGRMNPAGIPYLYTSFDPQTARSEVSITKRTSLTVFTATFELKTPLEVIDLTSLPTSPSVFDIENKGAREYALFLDKFVMEISRPISKSGREHIEYVPTQVICEYLAQIFKPRPGTRLGGLVFPSSVHPGGKNLVVFPDDRYAGKYHGVTFNSG